MPPTRSSGRNTIATTMIPMPPNHCSNPRQSSIPRGKVSSPPKTVDPVVVNPLIASKTASTTACFGGAKHEGQSTKHRQGHPNAGGQQKGLLQAEAIAPPVLARQGKDCSGRHRNDTADKKGRPVGVAVHQIHGQAAGAWSAPASPPKGRSHIQQVECQTWPQRWRLAKLLSSAISADAVVCWGAKSRA